VVIFHLPLVIIFKVVCCLQNGFAGQEKRMIERVFERKTKKEKETIENMERTGLLTARSNTLSKYSK